MFPEAADPYGFSKATIELAKEEGVKVLVVAGNVSPDDFIVFAQSNGASKWRTTPHKHGKEGIAANRAGDMNPPSGSFFYGMLQSDPDAGVNTVSDLASLIKSIDPCEKIIRELGTPFAE